MGPGAIQRHGPQGDLRGWRSRKQVRLIATSCLEPGMTVAQDLHSGFHHELPLVRAGVRIEEQHKLALARAGVYAVYVDDELGEGIEVTPVLTQETRALAMSALVRTFAETAVHP